MNVTSIYQAPGHPAIGSTRRRDPVRNIHYPETDSWSTPSHAVFAHGPGELIGCQFLAFH